VPDYAVKNTLNTTSSTPFRRNTAFIFIHW